MEASQVFFRSFLGKSPDWYKLCILGFLTINPVLYFYVSPFVAGWVLVAEFIFTLSMALKCYPLQPGGLLAIEAVIIGMTSPHHIKQEVMANFDVILLLMFMVAGIYFMKQLLLHVFTKLLIAIHSKKLLALAFCLSAAFLSAFLDALTVIAVIISVGTGFYGVYHKVASGNSFEDSTDITNDDKIQSKKEILDQFRAFLRSLLMHAGVGSALGGVMTMVGEPQNLIIAGQAEWGFVEFLLRVLPISLPVLICGAMTCLAVEHFKIFGYGAKLPKKVWVVLARYNQSRERKMTKQDRLKMGIQAVAGVWLIFGLALHLADVGIIGLTVIIFTTAFCGITDEHTIGRSFQESMPFCALLVVSQSQLSLFYIFNGLLSMISDNVFVGTVYINEAKTAFTSGIISREQFDLIAVAINTGTNLPSVATPNGQAAFLFLLTSAFAPLIRLSYGKMVYMALPYSIVLSGVGFLSLEYLLPKCTELMTQWGWIITR